MPPRKLTPQMPGEPVQEVAQAEQIAEQPEQPAEIPEQIEASAAPVAAADASVSEETPPAEPVTDAPAPAPAAEQPSEKAIVSELSRRPGELPDAAEVDPAQLNRAVLTKQGWVLPTAKKA